MTIGNTANGNPIWDNFMSISNPQMQNAIFPQPQQTPSAQPELNQAQQMLSPSNQALQATFGQNPVFGNSGFGRTTAGKVIGNLALAGQQAGPSATPADAIRIVSNMVRAPQEYNQQQQQGAAKAQGAAQVQMGALADTLAQINERNTQSGYYQARGIQDLAKAGYDRWREANPTDKPENIIFDDSGKPWQPSVQNGVPSLRNVLTGEIADPNAPPSFTKNPKGTPPREASGTGLSPAKITEMLISSDPGVLRQGQKARDAYNSIQSTVAGGQAGARQSAEEPTKISDKDAEDLLQTVRQSEMKQLKTPQTQKEWEADMNNYVANYQTKGKAYSDYTQGVADANKKITNQLQQYQAEGAHRRGLTLQEWQDQKNNAKTAPPPPAPKVSKDWTPQ